MKSLIKALKQAWYKTCVSKSFFADINGWISKLETLMNQKWIVKDDWQQRC